ncbi:MAG: hypothetical protein LBL63_06955, partial [Clostridiales Family XIII bacterium]|nr:hypothetical protein [Clostridiales Family XIII bacterium]
VSVLLLILERPILSFLSEDHGPDVSGYYLWTSCTVILTVLQWIPLNFCRLAGRPKIGPIMSAVMAGVSLLSAFALMRPMGLPGIALGNLIGCLCSLVVAILLMRGSLLRFRFTGRPGLRAIFAQGSPFGMDRFYAMLSTYLMNMAVFFSGGPVALAVYGVVQIIRRFSTSLILGSAQTIIPIAGMLNAEKDVVSLNKLLKHALIYGNAAVGALSLLLILFRGGIAALFGLRGGAEADLFRYAIVLCAVCAICIQNTTTFAAWFNASARLGAANALLFLQELCCLCLPAFFLAVFRGGRAVWVAFPISGALALIALALILAFMKRRNPRLTYPFLLDASIVLAGKDLSFSVPQDTGEASKASARVTEFCEESGLTKKQTMLIALSVEEFIVLMINNNPKGGALDITCRLTLSDDAITMRIRNRGRAFDPVAYYREHIAGDFERSLDVIGLKYVAENAALIDYREIFGMNNLLIVISRQTN